MLIRTVLISKSGIVNESISSENITEFNMTIPGNTTIAGLISENVTNLTLIVNNTTLINDTVNSTNVALVKLSNNISNSSIVDSNDSGEYFGLPTIPQCLNFSDRSVDAGDFRITPEEVIHIFVRACLL